MSPLVHEPAVGYSKRWVSNQEVPDGIVDEGAVWAVLSLEQLDHITGDLIFVSIPRPRR